MNENVIFLYIDESGNYDFSRTTELSGSSFQASCFAAHLMQHCPS